MKTGSFLTFAAACLWALIPSLVSADTRTQWAETPEQAISAMREATKSESHWESKGFSQSKGIRSQADVHIGLPIEFEFNESRLTYAGQQFLRSIAREMTTNPDLQRQQVLLEGHTDSVGSNAYNQGLSERRADAVRHFLIDQGVSARLLISEGQGENYPLCINTSEHNRAINRRVELVIIKSGPESGDRRVADRGVCWG